MRLLISTVLLAASASSLAGPFISTQLGESWGGNNAEVGWRIDGGYKFARYFGLEGAYSKYHTGNNSFFTGAEGFIPLTPRFAITADLGAEYVMDNSQDNMTAGYGVGGTMQLKDSHIKLTAGWHQVNTNDINFVYAGLSYNFY